MLAQPDLGTPTGIRDRAMLETLYSTGMRRISLLALYMHDMDADPGTEDSNYINESNWPWEWHKELRRSDAVPTGESKAVYSHGAWKI